MSYQREHIAPRVADSPCVHLRSKAMIVTGKLDTDARDESGSHACWCNLTQHALGPDDRPVLRAQCVPGRDCFRDTR